MNEKEKDPKQMTASDLQKSMLKLSLNGDGFNVMQNYVKPIFKIEKVERPDASAQVLN